MDEQQWHSESVATNKWFISSIDNEARNDQILLLSISEKKIFFQ